MKSNSANSLFLFTVKSPELLKLIDSIQLLGVVYHFEREIEEELKDIFETYSCLVDDMRISQLLLYGSDY